MMLGRLGLALTRLLETILADVVKELELGPPVRRGVGSTSCRKFRIFYIP